MGCSPWAFLRKLLGGKTAAALGELVYAAALAEPENMRKLRAAYYDLISDHLTFERNGSTITMKQRRSASIRAGGQDIGFRLVRGAENLPEGAEIVHD